MDILETLHQYLDADDVNEETFEAIVAISREESFDAGHIIFREDQSSDQLYVVTQGQVDVQYLLPSGKRMTVDTLNPGDFLVWSALVKPYRTDSIAICRAQSNLLAIESEPLRKICDEDTHFGYHMVSQLARVIRRRLQAARLQIADSE